MRVGDVGIDIVGIEAEPIKRRAYRGKKIIESSGLFF